MDNIIDMRIDLQLFGEGGEGGGEGAAGGGDLGTDAASQRAEGAQDASGMAADAAQQRDRQAEWQKLITGEYKDMYTRDTQNMINKRFRQQKESEEAAQKSRSLAEKVAARYGANADDVDALIAAIDGDEAFMQEQADKMGMTREQYREHVQLKQNAQRYQQLMDQRAQEEQHARQVAAWEQEAAQLSQKMPAFNLEAELQNPMFRDFIRRGISMEHAYKMLHYDDDMQGMARYSAQAAEKETVDRIRARGMRPQEGASGAPAAVQQHKSPKNLTREDRARMYDEIVHKGKKISFG